jgi:uncharacterized damage-inducible protein DinB
MSIAKSMLPEFESEMASTRKLLERVPDNGDFKPHEKSMPMHRLAAHVAELPGWIPLTLNTTEFDVAPVGGAPYKSQEWTNRENGLAMFDKNVTAARAALEKAEDSDMHVMWALKAGGAEVMAMPRIAVLRAFAMNHLIHHRAQLGVYLRLNDVPLPEMYGPTADSPK